MKLFFISIPVVLLFLTLRTVKYSLAEIYYVIPTASSPCPEKDASCFTLSHYSSKLKSYFAINTTLILLPGNHSLDSEFIIGNIKYLKLAGNATTYSDTHITCGQSAFFTLMNTTVVHIRELALYGCMNNKIFSVEQFTLEDCNLQGQGRSGTGLNVNNVTEANIIGCSFSSYTGDEVKVLDLRLGLSKAGGAIIANNSNITFSSSNFTNNAIAGKKAVGGAVYANSCNITMNNCKFTNNAVTVSYNGRGGAVFAVGEYVSVVLSGSTFTNNSVSGGSGSGGAMEVAPSRTTVNNCTFNSNTVTGNNGIGYGGALCSFSNITINGCKFISNVVSGNPGCGGAVFNPFYNIAMKNSILSNNTAAGDPGDGGAVYTIFSTMSMERNTFSNNSASGHGGAVYLVNVTLYSNGSLHIHNNKAGSGVMYAQQSNLRISGNTTLSNNNGSLYVYSSNIIFLGNTTITNSSTSQEGGAVTGIQSALIFTGTVNLRYNEAIWGGAILVTQSKLYVYGDVTIAHNVASLSGGGIYAYQSELNLMNHIKFSNNSAVNMGGGIHLVGSVVRMTNYSKTYFIGNSAQKGGGACLEMNAKIYIVKLQAELNFSGRFKPQWINGNRKTWIRLEFTGNFAKYGGAIFIIDKRNSGTCQATSYSGVSSISSSDSECFLQGLVTVIMPDGLTAIKSNTFNVRNTYFTANSANVSGDEIYGGLLDRCTINPSAEFSQYTKHTPHSLQALHYIFNITNLSSTNSSKKISSDPVRVCFCNENQPDCSYHPKPLYAYKGEAFTVSLVAVDQINNTMSNSTIHGHVPLPASLGEMQSTQKTNGNGSCTGLKYIILSPQNNDYVNLSLYAEGPCMDVGISTANITVYIEPCPIGFSDTKNRCYCDPILYTEYVWNCSIDTQTVLRKDNVWFSYVNITDHPKSYVYILHKHCPFDYCHPASKLVVVNLSIPDGADAMCNFNRTSKLCGSCKDGLSLSLGSSRCMQCSNDWIALLIVFAIAGVALVALLLFCNLTVAVGTINGLIFYANIVVANRAIFLPFDKPNFLTIFIAWINLDIGFDTCFYNGMDAYAKTWSQLAFPLYVISLVVAIIVVCNNSGKLCRKFSDLFTKGKDPVSTLATLILFSYSKLLRTIIASVSFTTLKYSNGSQELVWLTDANILYLKGKYILLFITALVIVMVGSMYTFLLFSWQWLVRIDIRHLTWLTNNTKVIHFMDVYHNPYNKDQDHRYWVGLLLLVRVLLYLVSAVNSFGDPCINLLSITIAVVILFFYQLFPKHKIAKSQVIFTIESISLLNLICFTSVTLYITGDKESQHVVAYISTTIAFITFILILIYHSFTFILTPILKSIFKTKHSLPSNQPTLEYYSSDVSDNEEISVPNVTVVDIKAIKAQLQASNTHSTNDSGLAELTSITEIQDNLPKSNTDTKTNLKRVFNEGNDDRSGPDEFTPLLAVHVMQD